MIPYLDWIAMSLTLGGSVLLARKHRAGWAVRIVGDAAWMAWALGAGTAPLLLTNLVFLGVDGYGLRAWRKRTA